MNQQLRPLVEVVELLRKRGYGASDIARALNRSPERIRQIMRDLQLSRPRINTDADIPADLIDRVLAIRKLQNAPSTFPETTTSS
jgi:phenylalanyl-tRNA synthetase beta subunit